uniref:Phosphodiesterase n=1 Tax=Globodera pallida TaxID=36090 RepID=A0A183CBI4_GLOPA
MRILNDVQASDEETLIFGVTVINKTLHGVPDQDTFFDVVDCLDSQGMENAIRTMTRMNNTQLNQQCALYEQELRKEDAALDSDSSSLGGGGGGGGVVQNGHIAKMRLNGNAIATDRRNAMRKRQQEHEEQIRHSSKNIISKLEEQQRKLSSEVVNKKMAPTTAAAAAGGLTKRNSLDEVAERFEKSLQLNQPRTAPGRIQQPPAPLIFQAELEKENIISNGVDQEEEDEPVQEAAKPMKAPPPSIPTNLFSPTDKKSMTFPEPEKAKEPTPPPEPEKPKRVILEDDDGGGGGGGGGGFAAMLQRRAKKMESGSTLRKGLMEQHKASESEAKWKEAAGRLKDKPMIINDYDFSECLEFDQDPIVLARAAQVAQDKGFLPGSSGPPIPSCALAEEEAVDGTSSPEGVAAVANGGKRLTKWKGLQAKLGGKRRRGDRQPQQQQQQHKSKKGVVPLRPLGGATKVTTTTSTATENSRRPPPEGILKGTHARGSRPPRAVQYADGTNSGGDIAGGALNEQRAMLLDSPPSCSSSSSPSSPLHRAASPSGAIDQYGPMLLRPCKRAVLVLHPSPPHRRRHFRTPCAPSAPSPPHYFDPPDWPFITALRQAGWEVQVFDRWNVCDALQCPSDVLARWLTVIEANYQAGNAYHNATHAADVLQATSYFLKSESVGQMIQDQHASAALIAATVHDLDHPGRGNAFLMNTRQRLALLYNDQSILENHHVALAFQLTLSQPGVNIFAKMSREEFIQMRQAVIDMVLATDMSRHFEHLAKFQQLMAIMPDNTEEERDANSLIICRMMVKCADIANPTREWRLCHAWAMRIVEEYFDQTAEETERKLPITMKGFDRETCNVPLTQCTFVDMFARETFTLWCEFAELPHLLIQLEENYKQWKTRSADWDPKKDNGTLLKRTER